MANSYPVSWILPYPSVLMLVNARVVESSQNDFYLSIYVLEDHPGYFFFLNCGSRQIIQQYLLLSFPALTTHVSWLVFQLLFLKLQRGVNLNGKSRET